MKNRRKSDFLSSRVQYISLSQLSPNPQQPRRTFDETGLRELADSICDYGILQPLTVRRVSGGYQLVAGERRMRAARLAGLREVPCLVAQVDEQDAGMLALIENLQRRDLDCFEEAAAIARLISRYGLSQEQAAEKLGKSQSAVANKLRLLRLGEPVRQALRQAGLTERHARALLRLPDDPARMAALSVIAGRGLNVAQTESYIERMLTQQPDTPPQGRATYIIKDVRLFLNSIDRSFQVMRQSGVDADLGRRDTDSEIFLTIRIPKTRAAQKA